MKKLVIKYTFTIILAITAFASLKAQPPPPPGTYSKGSNGHGSKENNAAPVGTADMLLVILASLYGAARLYNCRKTE